jgi:hypothetical protein
MGWYFTLTANCAILPEFIPFIENKYLQKFESCKEYVEKKDELDTLSKSYKDLIEIWTKLGIGHYFREYKLTGNLFEFEISKKVTTHGVDLWEDYVKFLKDILVPITSVIYECQIESDDYGDRVQHYSDTELRNVPFCLNEKIKSIEHVYNDDGTEIFETRVVYKRSIPKVQLLDLNRSYGFKH